MVLTASLKKYSQPYLDQIGDDTELAKFYGMIANLDDNVGRLLARLKELELERNTIVIFMTDNGTARGATFSDYRGNDGKLLSGYNAKMRGGKGSPYEGGHRVPCFIRWPAGGLSEPKDVNQLAAYLDLLPTLIDLCQIKRPTGIEFDGVSLAASLTGEVRKRPERVLFAHHQELPMPEKYRFGCVMSGDWRLITRNDSNPKTDSELYNIAADPGQKTDLADRHPQIVKRLRSSYDKWWNSMAKDFGNDSRTVLGDKRQNPTRLTCFEWHGSRHWGQGNVRSASINNGVWPVDVARAGNYDLTLRRWPEEVDAAITASVDGGKSIKATKAKIRIGDQELTQPIRDGASSVKFTVQLKKGSARLQSWLIDEDGKSHGAYYVQVLRND